VRSHKTQVRSVTGARRHRLARRRPDASGVHAILIIRLSAIGDIVMASPVIRALRSRYPQAHIAWLVQPEVKELLLHDPALDEVIVWPRREWEQLWRQRLWRELWRAFRVFQRSLRARRFDLAIDMQGLLKSGIWAWLSGAPARVGLDSREGSALLVNRVVRSPDSRRISSEYLHLAGALGLDTGDFPLHLTISDADEAAALEIVRRHGLQGGYAVICPFTTRPQKHWFEERWAELARRLLDQFGLPVLMLGGPGDRDAAACITRLAGDCLIDLTGETRLMQAAALIGRARLLVGVDTGLSHMGIALDTPTINLFGSTRPYLDTARPSAEVLYHPLPCSPCRRNPTCNGAFTCMRLITVEEVTGAAASLLGGVKRP
jgi:heptosyltransferase-1